MHAVSTDVWQQGHMAEPQRGTAGRDRAESCPASGGGRAHTHDSPRQELVPEGRTFLQAEQHSTWKSSHQPRDAHPTRQPCTHSRPRPHPQGTRLTAEGHRGSREARPMPSAAVPQHQDPPSPQQGLAVTPSHPRGPRRQRTLQLQLLPRRSPASLCLCESTRRSGPGQERGLRPGL